MSVRGMICLEMIGYYADEPDSQTYPVGIMSALYPSAGDFIAMVGNMSSNWLVNLFDGALPAHRRQG